MVAKGKALRDADLLPYKAPVITSLEKTVYDFSFECIVHKCTKVGALLFNVGYTAGS